MLSHIYPQTILCSIKVKTWPLPDLRDLLSAHHDRLGQAVICRANGAQGASEQPSLSGAEGRRQRQAVQLRAGTSPEGPVYERPLPLKSLVLTGLWGRNEEVHDTLQQCAQKKRLLRSKPAALFRKWMAVGLITRALQDVKGRSPFLPTFLHSLQDIMIKDQMQILHTVFLVA